MSPVVPGGQSASPKPYGLRAEGGSCTWRSQGVVSGMKVSGWLGGEDNKIICCLRVILRQCSCWGGGVITSPGGHLEQRVETFLVFTTA